MPNQPALVAWKTGVTPHNAKVITTVAQRSDEFPLCTAAMREGRLSLDQVGVIADKAADGSDAHYAEFAVHATVTQLRTAVGLEPRPAPRPQPEPEQQPEPQPRPEPLRSTSDAAGICTSSSVSATPRPYELMYGRPPSQTTTPAGVTLHLIRTGTTSSPSVSDIVRDSLAVSLISPTQSRTQRDITPALADAAGNLRAELPHGAVGPLRAVETALLHTWLDTLATPATSIAASRRR